MFNFLLTEGTKKDKKDSVPLKELCSDNFVYGLKNRVSLHYGFNKENAVCKTFLDLIDNEYIVSVIADTIILSIMVIIRIMIIFILVLASFNAIVIISRT